MKQIKNIITVITIISTLSCKAQNIVPYFTNADVDYHVDNSGDYYKDVDNDFNPFVGTWQWVNGNNSLTFVFKKEININDGDGYTYDRLVGEYRYIENGVEKVNTIADINNLNLSPYQHKIGGENIITKYNKPVCEACAENERRVVVDIEHPETDWVKGELILRYVNSNGIEKIIAVIRGGGVPFKPYQNAPDKIDVPYGEYVLIKQ